jgi:hypothetical protein
MMIVSIIKYSFFLLILFAFSLSARQADFYIVSDLSPLLINDQYEQPLTTDDKKGIYPYSPFQIINKKELLGDQITEAVKCFYEGAYYYLLKDENGGIINAKKVSYLKQFSGSTIYDTVESKRDITISQQYPSGGTRHTIKSGQLVTRIFKSNGYYFIGTLSTPRHFGWCSENTSFTASKAVQESRKIDYTAYQNLIEKRLEAANEMYQSLFGYFNTMTNQDKAIPHWSLIIDGKVYRCILNGSKETISQIQHSTRYVVQDIENLLLGKPFSVNYSNNQITIVQK